MNSLDLSPEDLREIIRPVLLKTPLRSPDESGAMFDRELWAKMVELGWLGLTVEEAHGGLGLGAAHAGVLLEELGGSLSCVPAQPTLWAAEALRLAGGDAADAVVQMAKIAVGEVAFAGAPAGDGGALSYADGRLNGVISHVVDADKAQMLLLPVYNVEGSALAMLPSEAAEISCDPCNDLTRSLCTVRVTDLTIESGRLLKLSPEVEARLANAAAVAIASDSVGGAAAILERTVAYMRLRVQFDRPIGAFQALKHRAAHWKTLLEAATALSRQATVAVGLGESDAGVLAACAKFYACDAYVAIAEDAVQLHGGVGFTWEHVCHLYLRRAKLNQELYGSSRRFKDKVAAQAFATAASAPDLPAARVAGSALQPIHGLMEPAS